MSQVNTTTTQTAAQAPAMSIPRRNPKDSMESTWRTADRSQWNRHHWMFEKLGLLGSDLKRETPVHAKTDKMPYVSSWQEHKWVLVHACWPLLVQHLYATCMGRNWGPITAFLFYMVAFKFNSIHEMHLLRELGHTYGFLDGDKHARDEIPDHAVDSVANSLTMTSTFRPMMSVFLAYRTSLAPASMSWWLPVEMAIYPVILDFWFYWYHRCMHEFDGLWKYHRTHHLTKHPNPLLSLYADTEQEIFDIVVIPLMTWATMKFMGLPMGFYEWWICHQYVVFTEVWGHSGLRIFSTPPSMVSPILSYFDMELTTEDHDLHHRKGWKNSHNYGKQTRVWDRLFNTCHERIEAIPENIDWSSPVTLRLSTW